MNDVQKKDRILVIQALERWEAETRLNRIAPEEATQTVLNYSKTHAGFNMPGLAIIFDKSNCTYNLVISDEYFIKKLEGKLTHQEIRTNYSSYNARNAYYAVDKIADLSTEDIEYIMQSERLHKEGVNDRHNWFVRDLIYKLGIIIQRLYYENRELRKKVDGYVRSK